MGNLTTIGQEHQLLNLTSPQLTLCPNTSNEANTMISPSSTIPAYFHSLLEDLLLAQSHLEAANSFNPLVENDTPELAESIADALSACQQALAVLNDLPTYSDLNHAS
jgi:hypothetical protein